MAIAIGRCAAAAACALLLAGCRVGGSVTVNPGQWRGWDTKVLRNPVAEVVVVPAIGRVMQFRLLDGQEPSGAFWSHPALGPGLAADENGWINFGGDKAWPAPQADWERIVGKGWPPPRTFDAVAYTASVEGNTVVLTSPVDPAYGMRMRRKISLHPTDAEMSIETTYEKVQGTPVRVAVWTITQLDPPDHMSVTLPETPAFPGGFRNLMPAPPRNVSARSRELTLERDTDAKTMIATDGDRLTWHGEGREPLNLVVENETSAPAGSVWPGGAHSQIYTSPDGAEAYVELELLGPLRDLAPGQSASLTSRYKLFRQRVVLVGDAPASPRR
jgi:hypothetical protein